MYQPPHSYSNMHSHSHSIMHASHHHSYLSPPSPAAHQHPSVTAAAAAASAASWKSQIISQIAQRNSREVGAFQDIFVAYARLMGQARQSKARAFQMEQEIMTTRHLSSLSAAPRQSMDGTAGGGGGGASSSGGGGGGGGGGGLSNAAQKQLEDKILKLQEDLTSAYRLQSENSHTFLRLKEQAEKDEKALLKKEEELAEKSRAVITLQRDLVVEKDNSKLRCKHLEQTVELLRSEVQASRAQAKAQETKLATLSSENDQLVLTIIRMKDEQAGSMNEMNSMKQELQKATYLAQAASDAKKQAEEGRAIAPTEIDLSDMNSIIDHVAWSSNFLVEIPSERKRTIRGHRGPVTCARYNAAGTLLASAGLDGLVKVYDARTGGNRASLRGSKDGIMNVIFSADDSMLLASGNDSISRVWSLKSSRVLHTLVGHSAKVWAGSFTADGEKVVTGSHDRTIKIWDLRGADGACIKSVLCQSSCNYLSLNRNDNILASAHLDTHVRFWSVKTGELMRDLDDVHDGQVTSVEFSRDGTSIVTCSRDNTVKIIDIRTYKVVHKLEGSSRTPYRNLINWSRACWSPDDQHVLTGGHAGELFFWHAGTGKLEAILPGVSMNEGIYGPATPSAASVTGASSGSASATASTPSSAAAVAAANTISEQAISCVDWNRNGRQVMSSDQGGNIHMWENELHPITSAAAAK